MRPIFSLCYTSRRPQRILDVVNMWLSRAYGKRNVEIIITVDADDEPSIVAAFDAKNLNPDNVQVAIQEELPGDCVKGWNLAASWSHGKILLAIADDFEPPWSWDANILGCAEPGWVDTDRAVLVNNGQNVTLAVLSIITRVRYEKYGYLFYPEYKSMFSDTENTATAVRDRVMVDARHLMFEHQHCDIGLRERDEVDVKHASDDRYRQGEEIFIRRARAGFPMSNGNLSGKHAALVLATKDDFCLYETCSRLLDEHIAAIFLFIPSLYWSGREVTKTEKASVYQVAQLLRHKNSAVFVQELDVALIAKDVDLTNVPKAQHQVTVEAAVRNTALAEIRGRGFEHVIIADGDELWMKGTLDIIDQALKSGKDQKLDISAIAVKAVVSIGLPGYPVVGAKDQIDVYMGPTAKFVTSRSPGPGSYVFDHVAMIHFSATRRSMQEIVDKHRASGHYGDPDYDFEGWIKRTLPYIRPGLADVHMYVPYQIWPKVGVWTNEILAQVPESLHRYLGIGFRASI